MSRHGQSTTEFILMLALMTGLGLLVFKLLAGDLSGEKGSIATMKYGGARQIAEEQD
jgi:hypothetical protein